MVYDVHRNHRGSVKRFWKAVRVRCWLNGVDVTKRTFYADPRRGLVRMFKTDISGKKFLVDGDLATEERRGRVVVRRAA